jgi:molybdopterin synthase catalytic subunit
VIQLTRAPIDLAALQAASAADGALCLFVGVVRDQSGGRRVTHLEYEAYEEMALPLLQELAADTKRRWPVSDVRIVHRLGRLRIGEASVAIAVASAHRVEAFAACRHLIDTLKQTVPIWKKEFFEDGAVWVEGPERG